MKNYINKILVICAIMFLTISCDKDEELTYLSDVRFSAPIVATPNALAITAGDLSRSVITVSWQPVHFPIDAPVTYALQFDQLADTFGETGWSHAKRIEVGEDVLSKSFIGNDFNDMVVALGLTPAVEGTLSVRVLATLDHTTYSEPLNLTITPYLSQVVFPEIYMPGGYQGFDPATAASLLPIAPGVFQGYLTFPSTSSLDFKFVTSRTGGQSYGANANGNFVEGGVNNFTVPTPGSYQITVNLNTMSYTAVPHSWGVIGTSTVGQWDSDTDMTYDYVAKVWKFTGALTTGALKFRLNNAWTINYGPSGSPSGETTNGIVLFDNPGAHTILVGGTYRITYTYNAASTATAQYTVTLL